MMNLQKAELGRTGLKVTVMGLGGGGPSKLGLGRGRGEKNAVAVVRRALDLGINLIDTSENYGTEGVIGEAIRGRREEVVLATKVSPRRNDRTRTPAQISESLDQSLHHLGTDRIDVYQLHGVTPQYYDEVARRVCPVLLRLREQGKIRFIGITERFNADREHSMLHKALADDLWDTIMVGFNLLNPSARVTVVPRAQEKNIGVMCMFPVRRALVDWQTAGNYVRNLIEEGIVSPAEVDPDDPLGFLEEACASMPEAAYRFCLHEPGIDTVLSGTGSTEHLEENIRATQLGPLPEALLKRLSAMFGHLNNLTGE
jgi:L-galactose dehydrogenase